MNTVGFSGHLMDITESRASLMGRSIVWSKSSALPETWLLSITDAYVSEVGVNILTNQNTWRLRQC